MPNQPKTPLHALRIPTPLWLAAKSRAHSEQFTLAEVIRTFLRAYVAGGITPYVTRTGRVLTDADISALADQAEQGYDADQLQLDRERNELLGRLIPPVRIDEEL